MEKLEQCVILDGTRKQPAWCVEHWDMAQLLKYTLAHILGVEVVHHWILYRSTLVTSSESTMVYV